MFSANQPFVLLDDARSEARGTIRCYRDPLDIRRADRVEDLEPLLTQLAADSANGLHAAGYFSYEAGLALEPRLAALIPAERDVPLGWFGLFRGYEEWSAAQLQNALPSGDGAWLGPLVPRVSRDTYGKAFAKIIDYIHAGDIYQANLTFRADALFAGHPLALYAALRERAGAGYGGVIFDGEHWHLSFSPELFFAMKHGRIMAKPMKGTAARRVDPALDADAIAHLASDPKQRAENLMIVDLLRNDLSRIAEPGSVAVPQLFHVESYPTIHQMTSTVTAQVKQGSDIAAVLRAIYPCGSITGAPKIRAMQVIAEVESDQRGLYCGSIGRIDPAGASGGEAAFNVAIRTLRWRVGDKSLSIGLGSGIIADSTAGEEWQECLAKGKFARIMGTEVDLIETMAFHPDTGIVRLEAHLERMKVSAAALGFSFDRHEARNTLHAVTFHQEEAARVRLLLARSGVIAIELGPMPPPPEVVICSPVLRVAAPEDYRLHHKTSDRRVYAAPDIMPSPGYQPIFHDADGVISEAAYYNVFVERDGQLLTPPLTLGVLPGVLRGALLAEGRAVESTLTLADLANSFFVGNSSRGLIPARLCR